MNSEVRATESRYMPIVGWIIKRHFHLLPKDLQHVELSTEEEDTKESFDLIYKSQVEISVRIRKYQYLSYGDFTIRYRSKYGNETEIHKLRAGKGSIYLYAWESEDQSTFAAYILVDINKIRDVFNDNNRKIMGNDDGTQFVAYRLDEIQEGVIYHKQPKQL